MAIRSGILSWSTRLCVAAVLLHHVSLLVGSSEPGPAADSRPNILLIMTDQQHAGMLSCAGNRYVHTPALDSLASSGTRFECAYATNPVCVPSRFSLQTGRMPSAIGMRTNEVNLPVPPDMCIRSLGPLLKGAGYRCAYGGKVHLPLDLSKYMMQHGYQKLTLDERDQLAAACARFLRQPHDRPFFLFASFINPHDICYMAINDFARHNGRPITDNIASKTEERLLNQARGSADLDAFIRQHCPPLPDNFEVPALEPGGIGIDYVFVAPFRRYAREQWSEQTWRLHRWLYCRLTETVDAQIGVVLQALKQAGLDKNTLVVFTSDHGDMDSAHRLEHKSVLYEESVRIPFIVAWQGRLPAGKVDREHLLSNGLDLLPTLCDYAGVTPPPGLPGRSVRPLLEGRAAEGWPDYVAVESNNGRMVRTPRFKYCVYEHGDNREMLIDLSRDPGEMSNLANSPEYRHELNRHRRILSQWVNQIDDKTGRPYTVSPEPAKTGPSGASAPR